MPYFKINTPFFSCNLFFEEYLDPKAKINKMVNKQRRLPTQFFRINLMVHAFIFLQTTQGFISPKYLLNFLSDLSIPPWLGKNFTQKFLFSSNLNTISQKIEYRYFYRCLRRLNSPPGCYQHHLGRRKLLIPPQAAFFQEFIFLQQKGSWEETMIDISCSTHIIKGKEGSKHPLNPSVILNYQLLAKSNPSCKDFQKKN